MKTVMNALAGLAMMLCLLTACSKSDDGGTPPGTGGSFTYNGVSYKTTYSVYSYTTTYDTLEHDTAATDTTVADTIIHLGTLAFSNGQLGNTPRFDSTATACQFFFPGVAAGTMRAGTYTLTAPGATYDASQNFDSARVTALTTDSAFIILAHATSGKVTITLDSLTSLSTVTYDLTFDGSKEVTGTYNGYIPFYKQQ